MNRVGQFELLEILGDGGMGVVYRGLDSRFDRQVAVKLLHPQFARDPEIAQRFRSEAVIQAKLSHPHVVTVYDFVAEEKTLAMVMELVEGEPLNRVIAGSGGALAREWIVTVMSQVLSAIGYAHEQGLVHRDLKPSNIMVREFDGEPMAKVMDFGVAKILGADKMRTATSAKMGTLAYMSPEHVQSPKLVDHRSDIYSLGVVLYEMVTGKVPFDAESEYELMRQIVEERPQPFRTESQSGAGKFGAVAFQAMEKEPSRRFASCSEFRRALRSPTVAAPAGVSTASGIGRPSQAPPPTAHSATAEIPIDREATDLAPGRQEAGVQPRQAAQAETPTHAQARAGGHASTMGRVSRGPRLIVAVFLLLGIAYLALQEMNRQASRRSGGPGIESPSASGIEEPGKREVGTMGERTEPRTGRSLQPATPPPPLPEPSVRQFVERFLRVSSDADADRLTELYADHVDFFGAGLVDRDFIRKDKARFFRRWPIASYSLADGVPLSIGTREQNRRTAVFENDFRVSDGKQWRAGRAKNYLVLERYGVTFRIVDEKQEILSRESGP